MIHYKVCIWTLIFFINLFFGTEVPLESAAREQERFLIFRKLHNDKHDSSSSQLLWELNFHAV